MQDEYDLSLTDPDDDRLDDNADRGMLPVPQLVDSPAEGEAIGNTMLGKLAGRDIKVPPVKAWRSSAVSAMKDGDFEHWAKVTLDNDGWDLWVDVDPTMAQIEALFESLSGQMGVSRGNSRAQRRSSRSTRRR